MTEAAGVTHAFGVLGGSVLAIVQEMSKGSATRFIPVRHEQVAASAADGFGRISGRPAMAFGVVTAGATNLLVGVAIAKRDANQ
jgi:acetolactate synthase-1/2/3 large subunit